MPIPGSLCDYPFLIALPALPPVPGSWQPSHAYSLGDKVINSSNIYVCTQAGTSAASGGPTGTGVGIVDGTCKWDYFPLAPPALPGFPSLSLPYCALDEF